MGTYLTPSSNSTLNTTTAPITAQAIAGEDVKAGDLVSQGTNGQLYWAGDPSAPLAQYRPLSLTGDTYFVQGGPATTVTASSSAYNDNLSYSQVTLNTGNYLISWSASTTVNYSIYNKDGTVRVAGTSLGARSFPGATDYAPMVAKLLNNGNVIILAQGASGYLTGYIVSPEGVVVTPAFVIDSTPVYFVDAVVLTGGNVAITWTAGANSTSLTTKYAVVSPSGTGVQAPVTLSGTNTFAGTRSASIAAQTDGTFAVTWFSSSGTTGAFIQKFTATGAPSGNATSFSTVNNVYQKLQMVALTSGGYAIVHTTNSNVDGSVVHLRVFQSNLAVQSPIILTGASVNIAYTATDLLATPDGSVVVVFGAVQNSVAVVVSAKYTAAGAVVIPQTNLALTKMPASAGQVMRLYAAADGSQTFFLTYSNGGTAYIAQLDVGLLFVRGTSTLAGSSGAPFLAQWFDNYNTSAFDLTVFANDSSSGMGKLTFQQYIYFLVGRAPFGVVQADVAKGSLVTAVVVGSAQTRLIFTKPQAFDFTSTAGQKFSILGNTAILKGIQP